MTYPTPSRSVPAICFDLDGTLAEDTWPSPHIGDPIPEGVEALIHYSEEGYAIYIHTARPESHEPAIARWLQAHGIADVVYDIRCGKPIADLYVDDRAWKPPWVAEAKKVKEPARFSAAGVEWEEPEIWEAVE